MTGVQTYALPVFTVRHNLDDRNIKVTAQTTDKKPYSVKYKIKNKNVIIVTTNDSVPIQLSIAQGKRPEEETWYKVAQYSTRTLMAVRSASVGYKRTMMSLKIILMYILIQTTKLSRSKL